MYDSKSTRGKDGSHAANGGHNKTCTEWCGVDAAAVIVALEINQQLMNLPFFRKTSLTSPSAEKR